MFIMKDLNICIIKQNKAKVEDARYDQFSETSGWNFLEICKSVVDRVPLFQ